MKRRSVSDTCWVNSVSFSDTSKNFGEFSDRQEKGKITDTSDELEELYQPIGRKGRFFRLKRNFDFCRRIERESLLDPHRPLQTLVLCEKKIL